MSYPFVMEGIGGITLRISGVTCVTLTIDAAQAGTMINGTTHEGNTDAAQAGTEASPTSPEVPVDSLPTHDDTWPQVPVSDCVEPNDGPKTPPGTPPDVTSRYDEAPTFESLIARFKALMEDEPKDNSAFLNQIERIAHSRMPVVLRELVEKFGKVVQVPMAAPAPAPVVEPTSTFWLTDAISAIRMFIEPTPTFWITDAIAAIQMFIDGKSNIERFVFYVAKNPNGGYLCHRATSDISLNFKGPILHQAQWLPVVEEYLQWYRTDPADIERAYDWFDMRSEGVVPTGEVWRLALVKDLTTDFVILNCRWTVPTVHLHQVKEYNRPVLVRTHLTGQVSVTDIGSTLAEEEREKVDPLDEIYRPAVNFYEAQHKYDGVETWQEGRYTLKVDWPRTFATSMENW